MPLGKAVLITDGRADLARLTVSLQQAGHSDGIEKLDASTTRLKVSVVVGERGHLVSRRGTLQLLSGSQAVVGLEARGGRIDVEGTTIESWDPAADAADTDPVDGRAWINARDGGTLNVSRASVQNLGSDTEGRHGLEWVSASGRIRFTVVTGSFNGLQISAASTVAVDSNRVESSLHAGVVLNDAHGTRIRSTAVIRSAGDGVFVEGKSSSVTIADVHSTANAHNGLVVTGASADLTVSGGDFTGNDRAGFLITTANRVRISDVRAISNDTGIEVTANSDEILLRSNRVSANRSAGVHVVSPGSVAAIERNLLDHNGSGVLVTDGNAVIGPKNVFTNNNTGINLLDTKPGVVIVRNDVEHNFGDGVFLVNAAGVDIHGNHIKENEFAAFGVLQAGVSQPYNGRNDIGPGRRNGGERVPQDFEARIMTDQSPDVPVYPVPGVLPFFSPIPKARTGFNGRGELPNPADHPEQRHPSTARRAAAPSGEGGTRGGPRRRR